jgi:hypothetical protein
MLRLKIVKTSRELMSTMAEGDEEMNHGTLVVKELVQPWFYTGRTVCCDSYFSSVATAEMLLQFNTRMIGVVKTATKKFPMTVLNNHPMLEGRGQRYGMVCYDAQLRPKMHAFCWVDRERRYFIATASSLAEGETIIRQRWRQLVQDNSTLPERVELTITQPESCEI